MLDSHYESPKINEHGKDEREIQKPELSNQHETSALEITAQQVLVPRH